MKWIALVLALAACHHEAPPKAPEAPEPTPVHVLIDDATALHLRTDQLETLRGIDANLTSQLAALDARERKQKSEGGPSNVAPVPFGGGPDATADMGHAGHGGMTGRHRHGGGSGAAPRADHKPGEPIADERAQTVRDAIKRALEALDPDQQTQARQVLADHDVDLE